MGACNTKINSKVITKASTSADSHNQNRRSYNLPEGDKMVIVVNCVERKPNDKPFTVKPPLSPRSRQKKNRIVTLTVEEYTKLKSMHCF